MDYLVGQPAQRQWWLLGGVIATTLDATNIGVVAVNDIIAKTNIVIGGANNITLEKRNIYFFF